MTLFEEFQGAMQAGMSMTILLSRFKQGHVVDERDRRDIDRAISDWDKCLGVYQEKPPCAANISQ